MGSCKSKDLLMKFKIVKLFHQGEVGLALWLSEGCRKKSGGGHWIVDAISFQKIYGLCGLKGHIVEIRWDVTLVHARTDGQRNVKIGLEF